MTYQLTTGAPTEPNDLNSGRLLVQHGELTESLGRLVGCGETFDNREDAQSAADYLNEHLDGIGAAFRVSVERAS